MKMTITLDDLLREYHCTADGEPLVIEGGDSQCLYNALREPYRAVLYRSGTYPLEGGYRVNTDEVYVK